MSTPLQHDLALLSSLPLVVDGALATEVEIRGHDLNDPLWSAKTLLEHPGVISEVHFDYFQAGADIAITSSYQASQAGLEKRGLDEGQAHQLIQKSAELAESARSRALRQDPQRKMFIAGSIGPYGAYLADGSEYRGDYSLSKVDFKHFHRLRMKALVDGGVDILACETMPCFAEVEALLELLEEFPGSRAWFSFTLRDDRHISDGTPLSAVVSLLEKLEQVVSVGVNCVPREIVTNALKKISPLTNKPLIVYPNSGEGWDAVNHRWCNLGGSTGPDLADFVQQWMKAGASLIGGCCRTGPGETEIVKEVMKRSS